MNILLLGGAKRVSMARLLKEAGEKRGMEVNIFSYELERHVPIAEAGEVIIGRRWNDPLILPHLCDVIRERDIRVVIPFVDGAVAIAVECRDLFGVFAPVSNADLSEAMFDKVTSAEIFERKGIAVPATWRGGEAALPLIAKPRHGSASKGIKVLRSEADMELTDGEDYLIQEYIADREEYSVDAYVATDGRICCVSPRLRKEVVGGEVSRTVTVADDEITASATEAIVRLGLRGALTLQYIRDMTDGRLLLMEINPRPGGGAVCSVYAGADIPGMILDEASGKEAAAVNGVRPGVEMVRYFQEVMFYPDEA